MLNPSYDHGFGRDKSDHECLQMCTYDATCIHVLNDTRNLPQIMQCLTITMKPTTSKVSCIQVPPKKQENLKVFIFAAFPNPIL